MDKPVTIMASELADYVEKVNIISNMVKRYSRKVETFRDFLGEKGMLPEYEQWLKANHWEG